MSLWTAIRSALDRRELTLTAEQILRYFNVQEPSWTDVVVTPDLAMRVSAYYTCVKIIGETTGQAPLITYGRDRDNARFRAYDHWMYGLLHDKWNDELNAHTAMETLGVHLAMRGRAYVVCERNRFGMPVALGLLNPDRVRKFRDPATKRIVFEVTPDEGAKVNLGVENVCHVMGLSSDGWQGRDPLTDMRESIGFASTAAQQGSMLLKNAIWPVGLLESQVGMSSRQRKQQERRLKKWAEMERKFLPLVLEKGQTYKNLQLTPENLQLLATREFSVLDLIRPFRVPPHMVGVLDRAIKANIEQQAIEFVRYCMLPMYIRIESAFNSYFFGTGGAGTSYYCEFLIEELMRGDTKSQNEAMEIELRNAALTPDEWRRMRNRPPVPDGKGEVYIIPVNMTTLDRIGEKPEAPAPGAEEEPTEEPEETEEGEEEGEGEENEEAARDRTAARHGRRPIGGNGKVPLPPLARRF